MIILVSVIVIATLGFIASYVLFGNQRQPSEVIKIGVLGDIDMLAGKNALQGAVLAAEQINAEGGVLGTKLEVIGEDSDGLSTMDINIGISALTRLITYHKVDYLISADLGLHMLAYQDIIAEHKKICLGVNSVYDTATQRVLDDYEKYKYFFRVWGANSTSIANGMIDEILTLREYTGFNKVAYLAQDLTWTEGIIKNLDYYLPEIYDFDLVYRSTFLPETTDFTSYLSVIEASGAEILVTLVGGQGGLALIKEWNVRQSPFLVWGINTISQMTDFWDLTEGKCEHTSNMALPISAGYPITSKTLPTRDAYIERWGEIPDAVAAATYDAVRFILFDAIERAGTIETDTVIGALEETKIETSMARNFVFTSSHDVMIGAAGPNRPEEDYLLVLQFQWQDGKQVPVYPKEIMEEAGATYTFPDWPGPWDNLD
jgi:branched-chain amino acid transport system substrate-binding protein